MPMPRDAFKRGDPLSVMLRAEAVFQLPRRSGGVLTAVACNAGSQYAVELSHHVALPSSPAADGIDSK